MLSRFMIFFPAYVIAIASMGDSLVQLDAFELEKTIRVRARGDVRSVKTSDYFCLDPEFWDTYYPATTAKPSNSESSQSEGPQQVQLVLKHGRSIQIRISSNASNVTSSSYVLSLDQREAALSGSNGKSKFSTTVFIMCDQWWAYV